MRTLYSEIPVRHSQPRTPSAPHTGHRERPADPRNCCAERPVSLRNRVLNHPTLWYTAFGKERPDILELLLTAGADVHAGMMGNTTLQLATKKGYSRPVEILHAHWL
jgi:hypothetical protein